MAKAGPAIIMQVAEILQQHGLFADNLRDIRRIELILDGKDGVDLVIHKYVDPEGLIGAFTTLAEHMTVVGKEEKTDG